MEMILLVWSIALHAIRQHRSQDIGLGAGVATHFDLARICDQHPFLRGGAVGRLEALRRAARACESGDASSLVVPEMRTTCGRPSRRFAEPGLSRVR